MKLITIIFSLVLSNFAVTYASAALITIGYTGTIVRSHSLVGSLDGETVIGSYILDTTATGDHITDGTTFSALQQLSGRMLSISDQTPRLITSTIAFSNGLTITKTPDTSESCGRQSTFRIDNAPSLNIEQVSIISSEATCFNDPFQLQTWQTFYQLSLIIYGLAPNSGSLFADPNGGLTIDQPINLANASSIGAEFSIYRIIPSGDGFQFAEADYGAIEVSNIWISKEVPEPTGLALVGFAILGLGISRRTRHIH